MVIILPNQTNGLSHISARSAQLMVNRIQWRPEEEFLVVIPK